MIDSALQALSILFTLSHFLALLLGVIVGLVIGILPGLGGTAGLALILPFLFGVEPTMALAMMIGLQSVTTTSDTFPAILMGIPGTAGSQATVVDGFPLAKNGQATRALSAAFISSIFGGLFGALVLSLTIFFAMPIILAMGFGEQMMLIILALTMVGMLTGKNIWKGFASFGIGLMIGAMGSAPMTGEGRLDFGSDYLIDNIPLVIIGLAMFATPEIVDLLRRNSSISDKASLSNKGWTEGLKDWWEHKWLSIRCATIGCLVGALPGLGGTVIDWIAYGHAVQTSKNNHSFGKGDIRGVIAPESANNAKEGGALIPTLLFGIPGSGSMAILLGGFILIGIEPGIELVTDKLHLIYLMIFSVAFANIFGGGISIALAPQISKLTTIKYDLLAPFMIALIFFAAFQATRDWSDLLALFIFSILGVYMKRFGWSRPALLIGFVLSSKVEALVYQTIQVYGFSFLERPVVLILLALIVISIIAYIRIKPFKEETTDHSPYAYKNMIPQTIFYLVILLITLYVMYDSLNYARLTAIYQQFSSILTMLFLIPLGIKYFTTRKSSVLCYDLDWNNDKLKRKSNEYFLFLILLMLLVSSLLGFVMGIGVFITLFLCIRGELSISRSFVMAMVFVLLLGTLSKLLTLQYPTGLLQSYFNVTLPWPLQ